MNRNPKLKDLPKWFPVIALLACASVILREVKR